MTVVDLDKVDGIGISKDNDKIALMISDHLDWKDEYKNIKKFIFDFRFKESITDNCKLLLENIEKQLKPLNIELKMKER